VTCCGWKRNYWNWNCWKWW